MMNPCTMICADHIGAQCGFHVDSTQFQNAASQCKQACGTGVTAEAGYAIASSILSAGAGMSSWLGSNCSQFEPIPIKAPAPQPAQEPVVVEAPFWNALPDWIADPTPLVPVVLTGLASVAMMGLKRHPIVAASFLAMSGAGLLTKA